MIRIRDAVLTFFFLSVVLSVLLSSGVFASAGVYYVDINNGDNENDGTSASSPWQTLHYSLTNITSGTLNVAAGTYSTGNGEANSELAISQNYVTIIGESGSKPTISGPGSGDWEYGIKVTGSHVTLRNLNITGFTGEYKTGIEISGSAVVKTTNNTIVDCRVYGNYDGISISDSDVFTIQASEIDNNDFDGISISNCTTQISNGLITQNTIHDNYEENNSDGIIVQNCNPEISRNKIYDNRFNISVQAYNSEVTSPTIKNNLVYEDTLGEVHYGILIGSNDTSQVIPEIYHNTIDGGLYDGIYMEKEVESSSTLTPRIKYNIITNFRGGGIFNFEEGANPTISYNDVWNNGSDASKNYQGCTAGTGDISSDPKYGSYSLAATSPCKYIIPNNVGDTVTPDYPGFTRPRPGAPDEKKSMGAYEYVADETNNYTLPGGTGAATSYRIFTVPLNLGTGADMLTAMENVLGTYDPVHWRAFLYMGTAYREFNSSQFASQAIVPGMGFWIITTYTNQIPFQGGPAPDGVDYVMDLEPGWHLIGLPWTGTQISLGNIDVTDGVHTYAITSNDNNLTQKYVWDYTGNGTDNGYVKRDTAAFLLTSNTGYFFKVLAGTSIKLTIPHTDNQSQNAAINTAPSQTNENEDDEAPPPPPGAAPFPDIKVNGQDGPVTVTAGDSVSVSVSLDPGAWSGRNADWWVAARTPFDPPLDWYTYVHPEGWRYGIHVCVQTPLFELMSTSPYNVLNTVLPSGNYTFYFAVDGNVDGEPDTTWLDFVEVLVE